MQLNLFLISKDYLGLHYEFMNLELHVAYSSYIRIIQKFRQEQYISRKILINIHDYFLYKKILNNDVPEGRIPHGMMLAFVSIWCNKWYLLHFFDLYMHVYIFKFKRSERYDLQNSLQENHVEIVIQGVQLPERYSATSRLRVLKSKGLALWYLGDHILVSRGAQLQIIQDSKGLPSGTQVLECTAMVGTRLHLFPKERQWCNRAFVNVRNLGECISFFSIQAAQVEGDAGSVHVLHHMYCSQCGLQVLLRLALAPVNGSQ